MISIPSTIKDAWDNCVKNLAPFTTKVIIKRGNKEYVNYGDSIVDLDITRTLYDKAAIGNCASSELNMKCLANNFLYDGITVPDFTPNVGDEISVYICPASMVGNADEWWCPQGVFYIMQVLTDTYTNVSTILAADVLTVSGDKRFSINADGTIPERAMIGWSGYDYNFETVSCGLLGVNLTQGTQLLPIAVSTAQFGYFIDGYSIREVLSVFAGMLGMNYCIKYDGKLDKVQFNASKTPVLLGRRAESITFDGSWTDYRFIFELTKVRKDSDPNASPFFRAGDATAEAVTNGFTQQMQLKTLAWFTFSIGQYYPATELASYYNGSAYTRRQYDAFTCRNMVFDPALELGDQVTVLGRMVSSLLADDVKDPLLWIEPGNDDTRIIVDQPHDYIPYWDTKEQDIPLTGPIGKLIVNYKAPQIAELLQSPAPQV